MNKVQKKRNLLFISFLQIHYKRKLHLISLKVDEGDQRVLYTVYFD